MRGYPIGEQKYLIPSGDQRRLPRGRNYVLRLRERGGENDPERRQHRQREGSEKPSDKYLYREKTAVGQRHGVRPWKGPCACALLCRKRRARWTQSVGGAVRWALFLALTLGWLERDKSGQGLIVTRIRKVMIKRVRKSNDRPGEEGRYPRIVWEVGYEAGRRSQQG